MGKSDRSKVTPLRKRTMTLDELQRRTLDTLKLVRKQFNRQHWEDGLSDTEFVDKVISPFETTIQQDRQVLKMHGQAKPVQ